MLWGGFVSLQHPHANISKSYLLDALDPLFTKLSDAYMTLLIAEFGTAHYYQADGLFSTRNGPSRAKSAPRSLRRALLTPQVNAGSLYRCGNRT